MGRNTLGQLYERWTRSRTVAGLNAHRFSVLLVAMLMLIVATPVVELLEPSISTFGAHLALTVFSVVMLLSAVLAVCQRRLTAWLAFSLGGPSLILHLASLFERPVGSMAAMYVVDILFLTFVAVVLLYRLFEPRHVTFNVICASLCVYLLLGFVWANVYSLIALLQPGSFHYSLASSNPAPFSMDGLAYPLYFSLVTMSTLGYGDIIPVSALARMLAATQAVTGQLYLVVLVARLVGLHISQTPARPHRADLEPRSSDRDAN
ncbi:MAG: hypothetical protein JW818_18815 [Pirellulales bacterium]|nr:hypothetical protein [Pirellulales bacterium]